MIKTWSITTTLRNPERLRDFLVVLKEIEGEVWDSKMQEKYQILLIQNRKYGYGSSQFYNGLTKRQIDLIDNPDNEISFKDAEKIFKDKKYQDPAMRGRQSINPLRKLGLVAFIDKKIFITSLGNLFLGEDYDLGEIFFRSFIKWQIPNPDSDDYKLENGHNIKPFVGTLHLINSVNQKSAENGDKSKGISKQEFSLFVPTLTNFNDIEKYADEIIALRKAVEGKGRAEQREIFEKYKNYFVTKILKITDKQETNRLLNNIKDYGDNAIRYFRLTRYIYIRGGGHYIDLEPRRNVEISSLLSFDNGESIDFKSKDEYLDYIANIEEPKLPWETQEILIDILENLVTDIKGYEVALSITEKQIQDYSEFDVDELKKYIEELRRYRRLLQENKNHQESQNTEQIESYIKDLEAIFEFEDRPILLEKLSALGLHALNDALKVQPNYPVGDDNEPTFTAPANTPDIECYYENFNAICEVTMLTGRDQWYNEGQPVMRHLRDFEEKNNDKNSYCLFIAPKLHRDTINTFWTAIKYEYEGNAQRIIPLSIGNFVSILKVLVKLKKQGKFLKHTDLSRLYDEILDQSKSLSDSGKWIEKIPVSINSWQKSL
jgi:hypothetical protein